MKLLKLIPRLFRLADSLERMEQTLSSLDQALRQLDGEPPPPVHAKAQIQDHNGWGRLKLLSKFVKLSGKAKQIELEWQKIQQDEADAFFCFQVMRGQDELVYRYKQGIAEGVKWCVSRFS